MHLGKLDACGEGSAAGFDRAAAGGAAFEAAVYFDDAAAGRLAGYGQRAVVDVGIIFRAADIILRGQLKPDGLPDAGGAGVGAVVGVIERGLLSAGLVAVAVVVVGADKYGVVAGMNQLGDVEAEGGVAAGMRSGRLAVDVDVGVVVYRAEMQKHAPCGLLLGQREAAAVADGGNKIGVADPGEGALRAERHDNLARKRLVALVEPAVARGAAVIKIKFPFSVKVYPVLALPLGKRVFRTRNRIHSMVSPLFLYLHKLIILL